MTDGNKKANTKKRMILIALLLFAAICIIRIAYDYIAFSGREVSECDQLIPWDAPRIHPDERGLMLEPVQELDFAERERIMYGKYGFRRKIELKEKTIVEQHISADYYNEDLFFGIYRDALLNEEIEEICVKKGLENSSASELGLPEPYPGYSEFVEVILEPGTYYLGVYSTNPREDCTAVYESRWATVDTELPLKEGEWSYFFSAGGDNYVYFRIEEEKAGLITIERDFYSFDYDVWLCDAEKKPICKAEPDPDSGKKSFRRSMVRLPKAGTYYLRVSTDSRRLSAWANEILYKRK